MCRAFLVFLVSLLLFVQVEAKTLKGGVSMSWDNITQEEISQDIENVRASIFDGKNIQNKDKKFFKEEIKALRKDSERNINLSLAATGGGELSDRIVVPFFYKKYLYAYGIIYKSDLKKCYYYNALGRLFSIEYLEKNYGEFPVTSYQYKTNGVISSVVYNISDVDQYMYKQDGSFIGRWFKENYYNGQGKVIMTRTLPEK